MTQLIASGTLVLAKGQTITIEAGDFNYQFNGGGSANPAANTLNVMVPFGLPAQMASVSRGRYGPQGKWDHSYVVQSTGDPEVAIIHYTISQE